MFIQTLDAHTSMKVRQFIRVEDEKGCGMFHGSYNELGTLYERHRKFPNWYRDVELCRKCLGVGDYNGGFNYRFAFLSIKQFKEWVTVEELGILVKLGHKVYLIKSSDYHVSKWQAIYNINSIVSREECTVMFI